MSGYGAILTEQNEERWRAIRKAIMPAYKLTAVRCVEASTHARQYNKRSRGGSSNSDVIVHGRAALPVVT